MFSRISSYHEKSTCQIGLILSMITHTAITKQITENYDLDEKNFNAATDKNIPLPTTLDPSTKTSPSNLHYKTRDTIRSHLLRHAVIPDVLAIAPFYILEVVYSRRSIVNLGNKMDPALLEKKPKQIVWPWTKGSLYSLALVDADVPTRENRNYAERIHWLVVNIPEGSLKEGDEVVEYKGPIAPTKSGMHRYIFAVFEQRGRIEYNGTRIAAQTHRLSLDRIHFHIRDFSAQYKLGDPIAVNFFLSGWPLDQPVPTFTVPPRRFRGPGENNDFSTTTIES
nr:PREDICTED: protein D1-like [Bemisia tabaci]XP_018915366.1 PREDICTED: protein D1-like [Bemisia tabaci]XP_018915367.1 PREDICTED: protein D1-like [Bemisia tabaci]